MQGSTILCCLKNKETNRKLAVINAFISQFFV